MIFISSTALQTEKVPSSFFSPYLYTFLANDTSVECQRSQHWSPIPELSIGSILPRLPVSENGPLSNDPCQLKKARRLQSRSSMTQSANKTLRGSISYISGSFVSSQSSLLSELDSDFNPTPYEIGPVQVLRSSSTSLFSKLNTSCKVSSFLGKT